MPEITDSTRLELLIQKVDSLSNQVEQYHKEESVIWKDHEDRIRVVEKAQTELAARTTTLNLIQAAFTTIASTVAVVLGKQ